LWQWDYEPVDLAGWIPDFIIHGVKPIYVEVKPIFQFDPALGAEIEDTLGLRFDGPYQEHEGLIVGAVLLRNGPGGPGLGWLWDKHGRPSQVFQLPGSLGGKPRYGLYASGTFSGEYSHAADLISGEYAHTGDAIDFPAFWRAAGNAVQWRGGRP
jgi:hypothetical protein